MLYSNGILCSELGRCVRSDVAEYKFVFRIFCVSGQHLVSIIAAAQEKYNVKFAMFHACLLVNAEKGSLDTMHDF